MYRIKVLPLFLFLVMFSMASEASLVTWDFSWQRSHRSDVYSGVGQFSYDSSAGNHVTHGGGWIFGDLDDELTAFSFEGFINGMSIGITNDLPDLFDFSADLEVIWAVSANKFFFSEGAGIGCLVNLCALFEDGGRIRHSTGLLTLARRADEGEGGGSTGLTEPGTLGLTGLGMLLGGLVNRRRKKIGRN